MTERTKSTVDRMLADTRVRINDETGKPMIQLRINGDWQWFHGCDTGGERTKIHDWLCVLGKDRADIIMEEFDTHAINGACSSIHFLDRLGATE